MMHKVPCPSFPIPPCAQRSLGFLSLNMLRTLAFSFFALCLAASAAETPAVTATAAPAAPRITFSQCNVDGPYIAFTFDDGPHGVETPRVLKMLRDRGIHATFFCCGNCVAQYPEIAKQIVSEGHEIANHSWSHPLLTKLSTESVRDQLDRTHNVIKQTTGVTPTLMRPPYGAFTVQQRAWAHATWGSKCILWDVDSLDWQHRNPAKTESIILSQTNRGSIILCHDIHKATIDAMPATLDALIAKGFKFVTVSELLKMHVEKPAAPKVKPTKSLTSADGVSAVTSLEDLKKQAAPAPAKP